MTQTIDIPGLPNSTQPEPGYVSGGQPSVDQLDAAAKVGVGRIINLRPASEDAGYDEAAKAAALGMDYSVVAIAGPQDLSIDMARQLDELLLQSLVTPTLNHYPLQQRQSRRRHHGADERFGCKTTRLKKRWMPAVAGG